MTRLEWDGEWTMVRTDDKEAITHRDMAADVCRWMLMHLLGCGNHWTCERLEFWIAMHGAKELGEWINGILVEREYDMWVAGLEVSHRLAEIDRRLYGATGRG